MGRGTIVSGGAGGLYQVTLVRDQARAAARLVELEASKTQADQDIIDRTAERDAAKAAHAQAVDDLNAAINAYTPGETPIDPVTEAQEAATRAAFALDDAETALRVAYIQRAAIVKGIDGIEAIPDDPVVSAWCADLTEDLSPGADVGTIAPNDEESSASRIIRPAFDPGTGSRAAYDAARDGQFQPVASTTPSGFLYNSAMLPGCQKWLPQYRISTVDAVDTGANTVDVTLDQASASGVLPMWAQSLEINQSDTLTDVPVEYLDCNALAFDVGDRVVVEFNRDWTDRKVIGFESNPKPCVVQGLYSTARDNLTAPFEQRFAYGSGGWESSIPAAGFPLNIRWVGSGGQVLTWQGPKGGDVAPPRRLSGSGALLGYTAYDDFGSQEIYQRFTTEIRHGAQSYTAPGAVVGAALRIDGGTTTLLAITTDNTTREDTFYSKVLPSGPWVQEGSFSRPADIGLHDLGWHFNASTTEAACVLAQLVDELTRDWNLNHYRMTWPIGGAPTVALAESASTRTWTQTGSEITDCTPPGAGVYTNRRTYTTAGSFPAAVRYDGDVEIVARIVQSGQEVETGDATSSGSVINGNDSIATDIRTELTWTGLGGPKTILLDRYERSHTYANTQAGEGAIRTVNNSASDTLTQTKIAYLDLRQNAAVLVKSVSQTTYTAIGDDDLGDSITQTYSSGLTSEVREINNASPLFTFNHPVTTDDRQRPYDPLNGGGYGIGDFEAGKEVELCLSNSQYHETDHSGNGVLGSIIAGRIDSIVWPSLPNQNVRAHGATDEAAHVFFSLELADWIYRYVADGGTIPYFNYLTDGDPVALAGLDAGQDPRFDIHGSA